MKPPGFSIIIPTWNNLPFLQLCCRSLQEHSSLAHQLIIHINDGSDGTLDWVKSQGLDYTYSPENVGICHAVNIAFGLSTQDYVVYLNDDMYVLPNWDTELAAEITRIGHKEFMLSSTMIEPTDSGNACVIVGDYGRKIEAFKEEQLLAEYAKPTQADWYGASWPPLLIHRDYWLIVGGFSIEFSPGMYSDPDLSMKLWHLGCRVFKGVGKSRVYHFQAGSTGRVKKNDGRRTFMEKWGLPASAFYRHYLHLGEPYAGNLSEPPKLRWERWRARWLR